MDARKYLGEYLTVDYIKALPTKKVVILTEGTEKVMRDGSKKINLSIEIAKEKKQYTPNASTLKNLIETYGHETKNWVGKVLDISIEKVMGKEVLIGRASEQSSPAPASKTKEVKAETVEATPDEYHCYDTGVVISKKVADFSIKEFGHPLCFDAQKYRRSHGGAPMPRGEAPEE